MNKYQIYFVAGASICVFMLWDMADYFVAGLGFPRGDWEFHTILLPMLLVVIGLLSREKKKQDASTD